MDIRRAYQNLKLRQNVDPKVIAHYQLKETIGKGGFSKVKRATHLITGQTAAVKIITKSKLSPKQFLMIKEEIEVHKQLIHQNICRLYEVAETSSKIYIFMQYCMNGDLFQYIKKNGPLQEDAAAKIFKQIYSAVKYMHNLGFCHRDIKGQNIILDAKFTPKIIDFGMAKQIRKGQRLDTFCGSFSYCSPQLLFNKTYIPQKIDIWCLGILLFTILAAELPFKDEDIGKVKNSIMSLKYEMKEYFSKDAINLLEHIFVFQDKRYTLNEMQNSSFFSKYPEYLANFINPMKEKIPVSEQALNIIELRYHLKPQGIKASIQNNQSNSNCSIYYLTLVNMFYDGNMSKLDINSPYFSIQKKKHNKITGNKSLKVMESKNKRKGSFSIRSKQNSSQIINNGSSSARSKKNMPQSINGSYYLSKSNPKVIQQLSRDMTIQIPNKKHHAMKFTLTSRMNNGLENFNVKVTAYSPEHNEHKKQISKKVSEIFPLKLQR